MKNKFKLFFLHSSWFLAYLLGNYVLLNQRQRHFFHIVQPSILPFFISCNILGLVLSFIGYLHFYVNAGNWFLSFFYLFIIVLVIWFASINRESRYSHTFKVQYCLQDSFVLFITSEIMFFFSFFWGYFHSSISPNIWIYSTWPPLGINTISAFQLPLLNTVLLLLSGWTITWAHSAIVKNKEDYWIIINGLIWTIFLSCLFTSVQIIEYRYASFSIYDGIYGSCFYMLTGFHGFHVFLGTIMLLICLLKAFSRNFDYYNHIGFMVSAWYWHFVDVVWIFLFIFVYWWGNTPVDQQVLLDSLTHLVYHKVAPSPEAFSEDAWEYLFL